MKYIANFDKFDIQLLRLCFPLNYDSGLINVDIYYICIRNL